MNVIVASSRGYGLKQHLPKGTHVDVNPGAKLKYLTERVACIIAHPQKLRKNPCAYIVAGIPDLTEKLKSQNPSYRYTETIFVEEPEAAASRIKIEITNCQKIISNQGIKPIFCTIPKMKIETYNNSLLKKRKTSILLHSEYYSDMQLRLNQTIDLLNSFIIDCNCSSRVATPCLNTTIKKRRGSGYYVYLWHLYTDGLHAGEPLKEKWAACLQQAFEKNDTSIDSSDEDKSPKRSWLRLKKQKTC